MRRATTATVDPRRTARQRQDRLWSLAGGLFFGSLMVWFIAWVLGLAGMVIPYV